MKFLLVLLAVFKYILLFLLILLLLIIILALVVLISPIRYSVTVNYKDSKVYLNINGTYLGKIVGFSLKKKGKKTQMFVRLFRKKIDLSPDNPEAPPKTNSEQKNTNLSTKVAQKVTPTDTLEKNTNLNNANNNSNIENNDCNPSVEPNVDSTIEVTVDITKDVTENINDIQDETKNSNVANSTAQTRIETESTATAESELKTESKVKTESQTENNTENKAKTTSKAKIDVGEKSSSKSTNKTKKRTSLGEKIYSVFENFNSTLDTIYYYIHTYQNYPYRDKLFKKFKKIFHNLFEELKPTTFDISGKVYIKDPSLTGKTLGYVYALYAISPRFNISLDADFETEKTDFTALISGKIIIFKLVQPVVSFILLGLKAESKRRGITRLKLIKILIQHE